MGKYRVKERGGGGSIALKDITARRGLKGLQHSIRPQKGSVGGFTTLLSPVGKPSCRYKAHEGFTAPTWGNVSHSAGFMGPRAG